MNDVNNTTGRDAKTGRFLAGNSGNGGRTVGSRNRLSESVLRDIAISWAENGPAALAELARTDAATYCRIAASLIPKEIGLTLTNQAPGGLDAEEWQLALATFRAIKEALPGASNRSPTEVMSFVAAAIRAHASTPLLEHEPGELQDAPGESLDGR